jgi:DNA-binding transcriptional regulator YhcF (GntR family)
MPSFQWIKLYHEILGDPKMGRLPDHLWRRCIELFLIAGQQDEGGFLPDVTDMAWILRAADDEVGATLEQLKTHGIVEQQDGRWFVIHFAERQAATPGADRVAQYRNRQRKQEYYEPETIEQQTGNEPVTECYTDKIREDKIRPDDSGNSEPEKRHRALSESEVKVKQLTEHFAAYSGLQLPIWDSKAKSRENSNLWKKPLEDILQLVDSDVGRAERLADAAIDRLRKGGCTIASPKSVIQTARALHAEGIASGANGRNRVMVEV